MANHIGSSFLVFWLEIWTVYLAFLYSFNLKPYYDLNEPNKPNLHLFYRPSRSFNLFLHHRQLSFNGCIYIGMDTSFDPVLENLFFFKENVSYFFWTNLGGLKLKK